MAHHFFDRLLTGEEQVLWWIPPDGLREKSDEELAGLLPGSFNPLHEGHVRLSQTAATWLGGPIAVEISVTNADKPRLTAEEVKRRCRQFDTQPVAVTAAATFVEKSRLFPGMTFIVGADTAARVIDPRFYRGEIDLREGALEEIRCQGCSFLVAARQCGQQLLTLSQLPIPSHHQGLFREIPLEDFQVNVSSTGLRSGL